MTESEKPQFAASLTALGAAMGHSVDAPILSAYWQFLRDLELAAFSRAIDAAGRTLKWFPKPAELRDLAGAGSKSQATIAWERVLWAIRKHDYTTSVDFGTLVNAIVRHMGGWLALCERPETALVVWAPKEFERLWALLETQDAGSLNGAPLSGQFGGTPVRVAIGGVSPPLQLEPVKDEVSEHVRRLADSKGKA